MATSTTHCGATGPGAAPIGVAPLVQVLAALLGRDWITGYLFVLPMVLLLFGLIGYPFVRAVWLSFHNAVGIRIGNFVGLDNYINLWADDFFLRAVSDDDRLHRRLGRASSSALGLGTALLLHNVPRWGSVLGGLIAAAVHHPGGRSRRSPGACCSTRCSAR